MTNNCYKSQPSLYWATIDCAANWQAFDRVRLEKIKWPEGKLTAHLLNEIAGRYYVRRGLASEPGKRECLCDILNEKAEVWPDSLIDRADRCVEIMQCAADKGCFPSRNRHQISAITKFMWFLHPDGWTMYDNFAAQGLGVRGQGVRRMRNFYGQLADAGFEETVRKMQKVINRHVNSNSLSEYQGLPATRIVDRFLMFRGMSAVSFEDEIKNRQTDLEKLEQLANNLEGMFGRRVKELRFAKAVQNQT